MRESCFKFDIHIMPNLPGSSPQLDKIMIDDVLTNLCPDQVKLYPTEVTPFTKILEDYKKGTYKPYSLDELDDVIIYYKTRTSPWIRNNRIVRDIPDEYIIAGVRSANQRQDIHRIMKARGLVCNCIRCREIGRHPHLLQAKKVFKIRKYQCSGGVEYFLSYESECLKSIYAFLRLRISRDSGMLFPQLRKCGLIRELHVLGTTVEVGKTSNATAQHKGLGKALLKAAEEIAKKENIYTLAVIAGIGTSRYYEKHGYKWENDFMFKKLEMRNGIYYNYNYKISFIILAVFFFVYGVIFYF